LGVYPGSRKDDKIRTLADLDRAFIRISATRPLSQSISRIIIVANSYVVSELQWEDIKWRQSNVSDFGDLKIPNDLVIRSVSIDSEKLISLSLADVVARRRKRILNELSSPSPVAQQVNVGSFPSGEHGWLVPDSEFRVK
jgi:hypothetical protein